ncbi:MAG TPA: alpha/beta hydrolase [Iamia sp.]|nr:alpha/beta hydrolase [Iamia sp.]
MTVELHHEVHGSGPPIVLLHGFPETHVCWKAVADHLADAFTVVCPDLRGYGDSPLRTGDLSKRTMATDVVALMSALGHERFAIAGHDRGGLVGQRLALDHPDAVTHLTVLDIVPVLDMWSALTADGALGAYHLFFLAQPADLPERLIAAAPEAFADSFLDGWTTVDGAIDDTARATYHRAIARPDAIADLCDDYRAGATIDLAHDREAREAGRRITAPVQVLWQAPGGSPPPFDPLEIWGRWADDVEGQGLDCGHFLPEERPAEVADAIRRAALSG